MTEFLGGPRGRRLCAELARDHPGELSAAVGAMDVLAWSRVRDPAALLPALADAVGWARYWQEPDEVDTALRDSGLVARLRPLAGAVLSSPAAGWWTAPLARHDQWQLNRRPGLPAVPVAAGELVRGWHDSVVAEERRARRERPADPAAMVSGEWWSTPLSWHPPASARLASTTPALPGTDGLPAGLVLVEDHPGAEPVEARRVRVDPAARVYEVTGPAAWADLAARYPLDVTSSRRHDWFRATGGRGPWAIPDWAAVAREWDGVHLTVEGYLSTAGRPLRLPGAGGGYTLLAGWDPGATWWLAGVTLAGPSVLWTGPGDHPLGWRRG